MVLRDRQVGGIPLNRWGGISLTMVCACSVFILACYVWVPLWSRTIFHIPEEIVTPIALISALLYLSVCDWGLVPQGKERLQLCFGTPTGISFSAGLYALPKVPLPIVVALVQLCASKDVSDRLGWTMEGDVAIATIAIEAEVAGVTSDGYRSALAVTLLFEVEDGAVYFSHVGEGDDGKGSVSLRSAITSTAVESMKKLVLAQHSALELQQGQLTSGKSVSELISESCSFVAQYGLVLRQNPLVRFWFSDKLVERAFDLRLAHALLTENVVAVGTSFAQFRELNPGLSEEVAFALFSQARGEDASAPKIDIVKLK